MIEIVAAMAENRVIGRGGDLPWRLPADLKHFKNLTTGHAVIMGRKTFESIGRALPHRRNIVVTRNPAWRADGVETVHSLDDAIEAVRASGLDERAFIIGGEQLFRESLPMADRFYLTLVHARPEGDVFFPEFDEHEWRIAEETRQPADDRNQYSCTFRTYERARSGA